MPEQLWESSLYWSLRLGTATLLFIVFYVLGWLACAAIVKAGRDTALDDHVAVIFGRAARIAVILFGAVTALGTLGIDVSALVAGLGLTGFALGFALKDTISNLLAGVLLLVYRPFAIGDFISVSGFEGQVRTIDLRYTTIHGAGMKALIPNSSLFTNPIKILESLEDKDQ